MGAYSWVDSVIFFIMLALQFSVAGLGLEIAKNFKNCGWGYLTAGFFLMGLRRMTGYYSIYHTELDWLLRIDKIFGPFIITLLLALGTFKLLNYSKNCEYD